jgi:hypothetical protein
MGQFSVTIYEATGSVLSDIQQSVLRLGGLYTKMEEIQGLRSNSLMFSAVAHDCFALGLTQHL